MFRRRKNHLITVRRNREQELPPIQAGKPERIQEGFCPGRTHALC